MRGLPIKIQDTLGDYLDVHDKKRKERIAGLDPAAKGVRGKNCNVTACQEPGAFFFNSGTNKHYCRYCATDIHRFNLRSDDDFVLFPNFEKDMGDHNEWFVLGRGSRS